jgi:ribonucleoside-diphosphate reductase alpha chain
MQASFSNAQCWEGLQPETRAAIQTHGLRNGCLTTIAPTGTISLLAGNVSSGIEPVFDFVYPRKVLQADGGLRSETVEDFAYAKFRGMRGETDKLPEEFVRAADLKPTDHLQVQAAVQRYVDSSISKTINCPTDISFDDFKDVYETANQLGLKGCTTYRPSPVRGAVLGDVETAAQQSGQGAGQPVSPQERIEDEAAAIEADGARVSTPPLAASSDANASSQADVVYLSKPLERAPVLHGATYKLKWPGSNHALYVTINDIEREGRRRPFEIFINTKSLEHYAWTVALTRMISAVFRRGGDVSFVAEELQAIFDPQGGRWISGSYVPSLQAAIGQIIEGHMQRIGFVAPQSHTQSAVQQQAETAASSAGAKSEPSTPPLHSTTPTEISPSLLEFSANADEGDIHRQCPRCGSSGYARREGCWVCERCGYSHCD